MLRSTLGVFALSCLSTCSSMAAQATWVVDALDRPGTHFVDLPPAVAAASPGDVLLVRYVDPLVAAYSATTIQKGLTLIGVGGGRPGISGALTIGGLPHDQHVVVRGFRLAPFDVGSGNTTGSCVLRAWFNDGAVHFQDVVRDPVFSFVYSLNGLALTDCALVTFSRCSLPKITQLPISIDRCDDVVLDNTSFGAVAGGFSTSPTLDVEQSRVVFQNSRVDGGSTPLGGFAALGLCDARIELVGPTAGLQAPGAGAAIVDGYGGGCSGASVVVQGPGARMLPAFANAATEPVFGLGAFAGSGAVHFDTYGHDNGIVAVGFGEPAAAVAPLWGANYWLEATTVVMFDAVLLGVDSRGSTSVSLPTTLPPGLSLWLQAVALSPK